MILDSGSTHHICKDRSLFRGDTQISENDSVMLADGNAVPVKEEGTVHLELRGNRGLVHPATLEGALYAPDMNSNLFSVTRALKKGNDVLFFAKNMRCKMMKGGRVVGTAHLEDNLWILDTQPPAKKDPDQAGGAWVANQASHKSTGSRKLELWHMRMGHLGEQNLKLLSTHSMVDGIDLGVGGSVKGGCLGCSAGKQHKLPFPTGGERKRTERLELVHSDLMGPVTPRSIGGSEYILTLIDDCTRYTWVYLLKKKSEVFEKFKVWKAEVETQTGLKLKTLRSDNGGEYWSADMTRFLEKEGIVHQSTVPKTPEQNGVAERYNRTLVEMARCMLHGAKLKSGFWGEALMTANYLRMRCPVKHLEDQKVTPLEAFYGTRPNVEHLRVFGCRVSVHLPVEDRGRSKMAARSYSGVMMGYSETQKAYRIWDIRNRQIKITRNCIFYKEPLLEWSLDVEVPKEVQETVTPEPKIPGGDAPNVGKEVRHSPTLTLTEIEEPVGEAVLTRIGRLEAIRHKRRQQEEKRLNEEGRLEPIPEAVESGEVPEAIEDTQLQEDGSAADVEEEQGAAEEPDVEVVEEGGRWEISEEDRVEYETALEEQEKETPASEESTMVEKLQPRRSSRTVKPPVYLDYSKRGSPTLRRAQALIAERIRDKSLNPESVEDALSRPDAAPWKAAMDEEMISLRGAATWELVSLPQHRRPITAKWIFVLKYLPDGSRKYKARFVARGFSQKEGIDYNETFAPVLKYQSLRMMLAIANERRMAVHQMDVKTAFLNGDLEEEIYMQQPEGYVEPGKESLVCRLKKSLYGLK